jgi:type III secretion protein X
MDVRQLGFALDRGLDSVVNGEPLLARPLHGQSLATTDATGAAHVDGLLARRSLDDALNDAIRPKITQQAILSPDGFRGALAGAEEALRRIDGPPADEGKMVNRCIRLLSDERALRDLVATYRSALFQG